MRSNVVAVGALLGALVSPWARADEALKLEQAVRLALDNNERAHKAPLRVDQAEGALDKARTAFFPSLTAAGSEAYKLQADKAGNHSTTSGTVTLNQPIFAPSALPAYSQASHQLESEKWGSIQDKRVLAFDTARAFLQSLAAERVLDAAVQRQTQSEANLKDTQARADAGLASTNDVTRAQLELANARVQVATAQGRVGTAYLTLGYLMKHPVTPPAPGGPSALAAPERTTNAARSFDTNPDNQVRAALDRRPDLRSAHEKTEALRASAREPLWRLAPTLSASGQSRLNPDPLPSERAHDETITLNLQWSIFDNGGRYADRRTRLAQAESQALDESLLRRTVDNDIRTALVSLHAAREAFKVSDEAAAAAAKSSEETAILYRQGLAKALELTNATSSKFEADVSRASAKLTMQQAYLELRFALGLGPVDDGDAEPK
jgi:outer membrane protein TolC